MRIFVIGGTGFLGSHLVPLLIGNGHDVTVLTRHPEKAATLRTCGSRVIVGDLLEPEPLLALVTPQDVVISIAMPEIRPGRMSPNRFRTLQHQVTAYFTTAIAVASKLDCPLILTLGTGFRTTGDEVADESWPIERFGMTKIGELVDPLIEDVVNRGSPPLIRMLPGEIYGPGGLFKGLMYRWMKKGRYRIIGSGNNYLPRIHVEDCAQAYVKAVEQLPLGEKFIIADDGPCTMREFADCMADCMHVPRPRSVPGFIIRIVSGWLIYETVTMNCRVTNAKARSHLNWQPRYPTYREGLPAAIKAIEIETKTG